MIPPDESSPWQELKLLRERLDDVHERHARELARIREDISRIEMKLGEEPADEPSAVHPVPPPLPDVLAQEPREELVMEMPLPVVPTGEPVPQAVPVLAGSDEGGSFELNFGKVWFVRIGIVILLTGLIFLGNYAYQNWIRELPAGVRLAALYACAFALFEIGRRLAAKASLNRFGEVLLAGGMAFFYYCTFAAHHVGRLMVIESPVVAALLLFGAAGCIAGVSWLRQSRATAVLGIVLASYSTMLQPIGWMSCVSNILLGAIGLFFMLRPAWSGSGWASMIGSYAAFFGWQILGANGAEIRANDAAPLWFLPSLWVMFAIPGGVDRFRETLGDRARAWFTGTNNAFFFLLFSAIWVHQNGSDSYWTVAAVFGPILIALGIWGRAKGSVAGGVNLAQGIAVATYALVLKLDGHQLALVLAIESVLLAGAFRKFSGRSEAVFSLLAAIGSAFIVLGPLWEVLEISSDIPVWSAGLTGLLLAMASVLTRHGTENDNPEFKGFASGSAVLMFILGVAVTTFGYCCRMDPPWNLIFTIILSWSLSAVSLKQDPRRKLLEIPWAALWFLGVAYYLGYTNTGVAGLATATVVSLAACWLWHREPEDARLLPELTRPPALFAWAYSIAVPWFLWRISVQGVAGPEHVLGFNQLAALGLVLAAVCLRCSRLTQSAAALGLLSFMLVGFRHFDTSGIIFCSSFVALVSAGILMTSWASDRIASRFRLPAFGIFRLTAFVSCCLAWYRFAPGSWFEWLAGTSISLTVASFFLKRKLPEEVIGFPAVALLGLWDETLTSPWHMDHEQGSWRGIVVVAALLAMLPSCRQRPSLIQDPEKRKRAFNLLAGLTASVATLWATQMLVWRFGWKPSAVLWTLLGFAFVSTGLWQRLHVLRISGFFLLVVSFGKLFAVDVWDFNTFMRVASFIVLGAALILLGLFYNHFAPVIKRLLENEREVSRFPDGNGE